MSDLLSVPEDLTLSFSGKKKKRSISPNIQNGHQSKSNEIDALIQAGQEELRIEIESLLRIVLPEEVTNINEMLYEFQGREDQLLDSLRKMKDRLESSGELEEIDITQQQSFNRSNPQAGISPAGGYSTNGDGQLKSPPELLLNNNNIIEEEDRKLPATENHMKSYSSLQIDEDEHDLPNQPIEDNISLNDIVDEEIPNSIQTSNDSTNFNDGMSKLKLSNLTTQSDETDDSSPRSESSTNNDSDLVTRSLSEETIIVPSKKTTAIVKLRIWDPAKPHQRIKCVTATHILLPYDTLSSNTNSGELGKENKNGDTKQQIKESRKAALIREEREESRNQMKRLSIVKEEPDKPIERGDSYFESIDGEGELDKLCAAVAKEDEEGEGNSEDEDSIDRRINGAKEDVSPFQEEEGEVGDTNSKQKLQVGTLVGIQLKTSSSTSLPSRPTTTTITSSSGASATSTFSYSGKQNLEWKVGSSINLHNVNFLPISQIPELHYQITNNYTCLKELVLDGLPYNSLQIEEAELLFDAIGNNTSIKRLSMRYSYVNDDYATLFALSLVTNQSLIQLVLEGNELTTTSAKNFYSVLKKNNDTLRLLDVSCNPIDEDVLDALDQFMEQRALKRTLTNKAEKARRAARGLPPDNSLDDEDDETDGQVTVVCTQSMIDNVIDGNKDEDEYLNELHSLENDNKPYPGEDFRDYMQRMDDIQRSKDESASYHKVLMDNSDRDLDAFQNFRAKALADSPEQQNGRLSPGNSMGSSITSRSTHKHRDGTDQENGDVVTTTNDDDDVEGGRRTQLTSNRSNRNITSSSRNLKQSLGSEEFARGPPALRMSGMEEPSGQVGSGSPHPYHTLESGGSGSRSGSLDVSQQDYMDPKAREREIRDRLARSGGAIGAYHMDEVAPQRQNRSGGARRGRMGRSASQRAARLAEIEAGGGGGGGGPTRASSRNLINGGMGDEDVLNADIERADDYSAMEMTQMTFTNKIFSKHFASFGLNDRDAGFDRKICIFLVVLALALLIMVIILATR